jgi:hypothetical protein
MSLRRTIQSDLTRILKLRPSRVLWGAKWLSAAFAVDNREPVQRR